MKCQKSPKNAHLNFTEPTVTFSSCFFCPNNRPKHKDSSFIFIKGTKAIQQFFLLFYSKNY